MFSNFFKKYKVFENSTWDESLLKILLIVFVMLVIFLFASSGARFNAETKLQQEAQVDQEASVIKNFTTIQLPLIPGQSIKWVKTVKASSLNNGEYLLQLPKVADKIKITLIKPTTSASQIQGLSLNANSQGKSLKSNKLTNKDRIKMAEESRQRTASKQSLALVESIKKENIQNNKITSIPKKSGFFSSLFSLFSKSNNVEIIKPVPEVILLDLATQISADASLRNLATQTSADAPLLDLGSSPSTPDVPNPTSTENITPIPATEEIIPTQIPEEVAPFVAPEPSAEADTTPLPNLDLTLPTLPPTPDVQVEYETPAPIIAEANTDTGKIVQISSPDSTPSSVLPLDNREMPTAEGVTPDTYTNILAFTNIPEIYKVGQENKIKIKWTNNGDQPMEFHAYDLNGNGKLDYVEWTVPHLSTQTFEIIFISKAFRLDENKNITEDIYDTVATQDNIWATIQNNEWLRFTFESQVDHTKNIDIYAKPTDPSQSATIEVYPVYNDADGNQTEGSLVATFSTIDHEGAYHASMANLGDNPTDVFDFKIIGSVDLDYVQDATDLTISTGATTCAGSPNFTTNNTACVVNTTDIQNLINAGTSVSFTATGGSNIVVSNTFSKTAGGDATISFYSGSAGVVGNITVSAAISSTAGKFNMLFNADRGAFSAGYISIAAALTSNGGDITMGGGSGTITAGSGFAVGDNGQASGVYINSVAVAAGGGNIIINGQGYNVSSAGSNTGVWLQTSSASLTTTDSGTINITGNGFGTDSVGGDYGVYLSDGVISTVNGNLTVNATGGNGSGIGNYGVNVGGTINITGSGNLSVTGTGGNSSGSANYGVYASVVNSLSTATGSGTLTVVGYGGGNGSSGGNHGVYCYVATCIQPNGTGALSITGTGGNGNSGGSYGVYIGGTSTIVGNGAPMTITGTGGNSTGNSNYGIFVTNSAQVRNIGSGTLTFIGTGKGSTNSGTDYGVFVQKNGPTGTGGIISTVNGNLSVTGTGGGAGSGANNHGVYVMGAGSTIKTTGSGNLSVTGTAGNGSSYGVDIAIANGLRTVTPGTGTITVTTDTILLAQANDINSVGSLTIKPLTAISVGVGSGAGTLSWTDILLGYLTWGSGSILTIGDVTTCGNITVNSAAAGLANANVTFVTPAAGTITLTSLPASTSAGTTTVSGGTADVINSTNSFYNLTLSPTGATALTQGAVLTVTNALTVSSGTVTLSSANTIGSVTLSGGQLNINNATALGAGAFTISGGTVDTSGVSITNPLSIGGSFTFAGSNNLTQGTGAITLIASPTIITSASILALGGVISGGYSLTKSGAGILTLSGANTYTGTTTISAGTLSASSIVVVAGASNLGNTTSAVILGDASTKGILSYTGAIATYTRGFTINAGGGEINSISAGLLTISTGGIATSGLFTASGGGNIAVSSVISGTGGITITKTGGSYFLLSGANSYTGVTTLNSGTLYLNANAPAGVNGALGNATSDVLVGGDSTAYFSVNGSSYTCGRNITIRSGAGASSITLGWASSATYTGTLTLLKDVSFNSVTGGTMTYSGVISGGFAVTKIGDGILTLSGNNTFTGGVTLSAGQLNINASGTSSSNSALGTGTFTISGGTIDNTSAGTVTLATNNAMAWNGDFTYAGGSSKTLKLGTGAVTMSASRQVTVSAGNLQIDGVISGNTYGLTKLGNGTLVLSGANTFNGGLTISAGSFYVPTINNASSDGPLGNNTSVSMGSSSGDGTLFYSSSSDASSNMPFVLTGSGGWAGKFYINTQDVNLTLSGIISGSGVLSKGGLGNLILSGANTYTGKTSIINGPLTVSSFNSVTGGGASSSLGHPTTVANGTIAMGLITYAATLVYTGTGEITDRVINLVGTTGGVIIDQSGTGLLKFTSALTATGAGSKTLTLQGSTAGTGEISGVIVDNSGTNTTSVTKAGTGAWTLSGANTYTGTTTISAGTLSASSIVVSGSASNLGNTTSAVILGDTSTTGILSYTGATATYTRGFTINAGGGEVDVNSVSAGIVVQTGGIVTSGNFTWGGSSNGTSTFSSVISGSGNLIANYSGGGQLGISGTNTYTGTTTIIGNSVVNINTNSLSGQNGAFGNATSDILIGSLSGTLAPQLRITGLYTIGRNITVQGGGTGGVTIKAHSDSSSPATYSGNITMNRATSLGASYNSDVVYTGVISGSYGIFVSGPNKTTLSGLNTYTGTTSINSNGVLKLGATGDATNTPLGTTAGATSITSGGVLDLNGYTLSTAEALTLNGTGVSSGGALINSSATPATYSGLITLGSASSIVGGTGTITISNVGTITGATFGLTLGGAAGGTLTSILGTTSGILTKTDAGTWTLSGANTYTGTTTISAGTLALNNNLTFRGNVTVNSGGTLSALTGGKTITFTSGKILQVDSGGTLTFHGSAGNFLNLPASTTSAWILKILSGATYSMDYVNPTYSDASTSYQSIINTNSTDGGHNTNWSFDLTPPVLVTGVNPVTLSYDNTATTVNIADVGTCTDAGIGMHVTQPYQVSYSDVGTSPDTSCSGKSYTIASAWGTSHAASFAGTDGHYYCVKLECKDATSTPNTSAFYSANNILYDITAPTISIGSPSASLTNTGPITYTLTYGGADAITLANGNVTLNKTGTADGTAVVSGTGLTTRNVTISSITGDGTIGISIASGTASDNAGNTALATGPSATFAVDNIAPTISFTDNVVTGPVTSNTVTASWGDALVKKWDYETLAVCPSTEISYTKNDSDSMDQSTQDNNGKYICLYGADAAGNYATQVSAQAINIDITAPTVTINQAGGQADPTNNSVISFTVVFSEAINPATFTSGDITTGGTATGVAWSTPTTSDNITWTIATSAVTGDGTVIPSIALNKITDIAGNDNTASTSTDNSVIYDITPPAITMTGSSSVTISVGQIYIDAGATATDSREGVLTSSIATINPVNTSVVGTYYVYYDVSDSAGNTATQMRRTVNVAEVVQINNGSGISIGGAIPISSPPQGPFAISINNGAGTTNNRQVTLSLQASNTTAVTISNNPNFSNAVTIPYGTTAQFDICQGATTCPDSSYTVYAKFLNAGGVSSPAFSSSITINTTPLITEVVETTQQTIKNVAEKTSEIIGAILPSPKPETISFPSIETSVPRVVEKAFQNKWKIVRVSDLTDFVFADLPSDVKNIIKKFPQVSIALEKIGINSMDTALGLNTAKISLPGLAESVSLPTLSPQTGLPSQTGLASVQGLPLSEMSSKQIGKIPTDMVFARTADEKIDLNVGLSIGNNGLALQTLNTIQGQTLKLVVKPEEPAESVLGYFIFKSDAVASKKPVLSLTASVINASNVSASTDLVLNKFEYKDTGNGVWTAEVASPLALGKYELRTVVNYQANKSPKEISMIMVVDPEGYVYKKGNNGEETRIKNAQVSIYWQNPKTPSTSSGQATYELWPASDFRQKNPQTTDATGRYAFLVPPGMYYLKATADSYSDYQIDPFKVEENKGVFINIEMKEKWSFINVFNVQNVLLGGIFIVLAGIFIVLVKKKRQI